MRDATPRRLFEEMAPWVERTVAEHSLGLDGLRWELSLVHLPNPSQDPNEPRLTSAPCIFIQVPTGNGVQHVANTIILSPGADEDYLAKTVVEALDSMRRYLESLGNGFAVPEADLSGIKDGR